MSELLRAERLEKTFAAGGPAAVRAVRDVSFVVAAGETVVVTGPSGSGKTTLLAMLGALLTPDAGTVLLDGVDVGRAPIRERRALRLHRIGFVFQRGLLLDHLTVWQNVALVPRAAGASRREARARAGALLARVGLAARADAYPGTLSAGEAQRAALARAVVMGPRLVLADEPTAHLDGEAGAAVMRELRAAASGAGAGLVIVTHDLRIACGTDRLLRLEDGALAPAQPTAGQSER